MVNLGYLYDNEKDIAAAEKYYQMAVERGHASAMGNLANLYYEGNNTSRRKKAYELSRKFELTGHLDIILMVIHIVSHMPWFFIIYSVS